MRFWDSSAIVPLCVDVPEAQAMRALLRRDPAMAVWWATRTECVSALARQVREGSIDRRGDGQARGPSTAAEFVSFDGRLRGAAHAQGFAVLPAD